MENETQPIVPPAQPLPEVPVLSQKNWLKILLFISLGLVVIATSVFVGIQIGKNQVASQQSTNSPTQTVVNPTVQPTTNPTIDPTINWKTFTGTDYAIKYPSDWHTRSVNDGAVISSYIELSQPVPDIRAKIEIFNYDNPKKLSSKEWFTDLNSKRQDPDSSTEAQSMTIDGTQAYVRIDNSLSSEDTVIYLVYLQRNDKMFSFWAGGNKKFEQTLLQILSTFKFIN